MPLVRALLFLFDTAIGLLIALIMINAILSWLVAFDVLNVRNPTMYRIVRTLDGLTEPLLRPIRRVVPNLGGIDISPLIAWMLLVALRIVVDGYLGPIANSATGF